MGGKSGDDLRCLEGEPQYVRSDVIAKLFGVTVRRVQQLTQDGTISTTKTPEGRRYDLEMTIKAYVRHLSDKAHGKSRDEKMAELQRQKLEAEVALKDSQAELHVMKREITAGNYLAREEVELDYHKFFAVFKRFALSIPPRLVSAIGDQISPMEARKIEKELSEEVKRMLTAFAVAGIGPEDAKKKKRGKPVNVAAEETEN